MARFRIEGQIYEVADIENLTIKDALLLDVHTQQLGRRMTYGDIVALSRRFNRMTAEERETDQDSFWVFAFTVWASKRLAGEDITFDDAISIRMSDVEVIPDPKDHQPKADPTKPRPASGRGAKRPAKAKAQTVSRNS